MVQIPLFIFVPRWDGYKVTYSPRIRSGGLLKRVCSWESISNLIKKSRAWERTSRYPGFSLPGIDLDLCLWNSSHIVGDWSNLFIPELKITQQSQRASENNRITSWIAKTLCIIICIYMLVSHPRALFVLAKFDVASFVRAASFCLILRFARSDVQSKPLDGNRWMIISYWMTSELVIFFLTTNHSVTNIGGIILPRRHGHMLRLSSSVEMYSSLASLQLRRFDQFTRASMKYMFFFANRISVRFWFKRFHVLHVMVLVEYLEIFQTFSSVKIPLPVLQFFPGKSSKHFQKTGYWFWI